MKSMKTLLQSERRACLLSFQQTIIAIEEDFREYKVELSQIVNKAILIAQQFFSHDAKTMQ